MGERELRGKRWLSLKEKSVIDESTEKKELRKDKVWS
jgi:hypothetical protein